jgi:hypothetical protein
LLADLFCIHMRRNLFKSFYMRRKSILLWPSIRHFHISTRFYLLTIINSSHMSIQYIQMNRKWKIPQNLLQVLPIEVTIFQISFYCFKNAKGVPCFIIYIHN